LTQLLKKKIYQNCPYEKKNSLPKIFDQIHRIPGDRHVTPRPRLT